ncbi:hypothetical protein JCM8547_006138, partial [Rhodosporidiobolus lusitaniae]
NVSELQTEIDKIALLSEEEYKAEEAKLLRKIDWTLLPCLFILLILNYLDRNALASARVQGIEADLGMVGTQFNTAVSLLFVGYILGQIPSNMILARSRPSIYLSVCVAIWGGVSLATGFVHNYHQLLAVRILLGFVESPYFPGALFVLSSWYTKKELAFRTAFMYTGSLLSGAFSGFISAGVQAGLDGALGRPSWSWLFIIEGAITIFVAAVSFFVLPDYPATTKRLSVRERAMAVYRMEKDSGSKDDENDVGALASLKLALADYRLYLLALIVITKTTAGAVTQFFPTVVNTFGFNKVTTLALTAPPYLLCAALSLWVSRWSDKHGSRGGPLAFTLVFALIGYVIAVSTLNTGARYFSLFLMLCGCFAGYNLALGWIASTFPRPRAKRAMAYACINSLGNVAQIWSPYLYPKSDGPRYTMAFSVNAAMVGVSIAGCFVLRFLLARSNARMDREEGITSDGASDGVDVEKSTISPIVRQPRYVL